MLNVVIPASGMGSRFKEAGFELPKPLIDVLGKPMIQRVVENINLPAKYIFLVLKEHCEKYNLLEVLPTLCENCEVVVVDSVTEGAACTVLLAEKFINNDEPLIIANSDQIVEFNCFDFIQSMNDQKADGGIITFKANDAKWSFAKVDDSNRITEVAEKKVISDNATVGIYYFSKGSLFVQAAKQMIKKDIRTRNEYYLAPSYNEIIKDYKIVNYEVKKMWGIGTPEDLKLFFNKNEKINT